MTTRACSASQETLRPASMALTHLAGAYCYTPKHTRHVDDLSVASKRADQTRFATLLTRLLVLIADTGEYTNSMYQLPPDRHKLFSLRCIVLHCIATPLTAARVQCCAKRAKDICFFMRRPPCPKKAEAKRPELLNLCFLLPRRYIGQIYRHPLGDGTVEDRTVKVKHQEHAFENMHSVCINGVCGSVPPFVCRHPLDNGTIEDRTVKLNSVETSA